MLGQHAEQYGHCSDERGKAVFTPARKVHGQPVQRSVHCGFDIVRFGIGRVEYGELKLRAFLQ